MKVVFSVALLATTIVSGSPIADYSAILREKASVSQQVWGDFKYYVQHAAAAYCNSDRPAGKPIFCKHSCPDVQANNVTVVESFEGTWVGIGGYVGLDHGRRNIIISLRGSSNVRNFVLNILFGWTDYNLCEGCMVHTGFSHGWEQINNIVTRALKTSRATHPDYRLVVTGHSLGGAVATLAAAHLRSRGYEVDCYTFGAPRVGNDAFANFVTSQSGGSNWRLTHYDDPVPRLPPMFLGYRHLSPEYWLAGGPSRKVDYQPGDVKICEGIANVSCNAGDVFGFDILGSDLIAHFNYLRDVVGCASFPFGASDAAAGDDGGRLAEWSRKDRELIAGLGGRSDGQQS